MLAILSTDSSQLNLTNYPWLAIGPANGNVTISGYNIVPSSTQLVLGGPGYTLTVTSALPSGSYEVVIDGNVTLDDNNSYTGGTVIDAGTLYFETPASLPTTGQLTINNPGVLVAAGTSQASARGWPIA